MKYTSRILAAAAILGMLTAVMTSAEDKPAVVDLKKFPQPAAGMTALAKNIVYPEAAKKDSVTGTVYVQAEILANGTVGETKIERGVRADLDSAAVKAIRSIRWIPGESETGPVASWVTVPIQYKLETKKKK
jgi:TonB family protein